MESNREEELYDAYLDALLAGERIDATTYLASRGAGSEALLARLRALHDAVVERDASAADGSSGIAAESGLPFERLGEFRLLKRLGEGGMGIVYLAEQEPLGRLVALKVVRPELSGSPVVEERFRREALAVAKLRHPNVVRLLTVGEDRGVRFAALELAPGRGLDEVLDESASAGEPLPVAQVARWAMEIARALAHAHALGVLHRDVKPSNIRIAPEGSALLMDFGLARELERQSPTITDRFTGSPAYAAPEQLAHDREPDVRTDVFSLGVVLYEGLTGVSPFSSDTLQRTFHRVMTFDPPPPQRVRAGIPRDLAHVVQKAIEKDPVRRYSTAAELADDLEAVLEFRTVRARAPTFARLALQWTRRHRATAAAVLTLAAALVLFVAIATVQSARERQRRARELDERVDRATRAVGDYVASSRAAPAPDAESDELRRSRWQRWLAPAEDARLAQHELAATAASGARSAAFQGCLDALAQAETFGAPVATTGALRAELYFERYREARAAHDEPTSASWRALVRAHDTAGRFAGELERRGRVVISTRPPAASIELARYAEHGALVPGGEPRLVPMPANGSVPAVQPGSLALRVVRGAAGIRRGEHVVALEGHPVPAAFLVSHGSDPIAVGDRLTAIDGAPVREEHDVRIGGLEGARRAFAFEGPRGAYTVEATSLAALAIEVETPLDIVSRGGARAVVVGAGGRRELVLPPGLVARCTAAPFLGSAVDRAGTDGALELEPGSYLAVVRASEHEDVQLPFEVIAGATLALEVDLLPEGTTPDGFVRVDDGRAEGTAPFWIQDRELTFADWLDFLNDPATRDALERGAGPPLLPRYTEGRPVEVCVLRDERWQLTEQFEPHYPLFGVSWHDVRAYADWKTRTKGFGARGLRCDLPTRAEWLLAFGGGLPRRFPFGDVLRPKWVKSRVSRSYFRPEQVLVYAIDESPYGVFDLCGGVSEWNLDVYAKAGAPSETRMVSGGAYVHPAPLSYEPELAFARDTGVWGYDPARAVGFVGCRLVLRPASTEAQPRNAR